MYHAGSTLAPTKLRRNPTPHVPPLATSILLTLAAALVLDFTATGRNGGSPLAVVATVVLLGGHVWALGLRRWLPAPRFVIGRAGILAGACLVALLALETLSNQAVAVAMIPIRAREAAQLGTVVLAAERLHEGSPVYRDLIPMEGYEARASAMPGLLAAYLVPRNAGADWRFASLMGQVLAAALAIGVMISLLRMPRPGMALASVAAGFAGLFLLPSAASAIFWDTHPPVWAAIAAFGAGIVWGVPILAGIAAGALAAMSMGWLLLLPAAFALLWSRDGSRALPGILAGGVLAATSLMVARPEFASFLSGVIGVPALMADPRQAADLEPWLSPTLTGALVTFKLAPPILVWAGLWAMRSAWVIARETDSARGLERFALAAFLVMICGPATTRYDLLSMALLGAGLLAAQLVQLSRGAEGPPPRPFAPALAAAAASVLLAAPVLWRLAKPHPLALDRGAQSSQPHSLNLLSGWHEPPQADRTWSKSTHAEVAFAASRHAPATIVVDLAVPGGELTPYNPVRIRLNQRRVGEWIAPPGTRFQAIIPVRDPDLFVKGPNVLSFDTDWVRSERELGTGPDLQPRGIAFFGLQMQPTKPPEVKQP